MKRLLCFVLAAAMLLSFAWYVPAASATPVFRCVGGWNESIYAEIDGISDKDVTGVSWSGTSQGSLTGEDLTYLVRDVNGCVRIDIPGLKAGTYTLRVTTANGVYTQKDIAVNAYDRSGFAHYNYSEGVGAYNDDGTLKDNAIVLYVTNENKNTVTVTSKDGTTVSGIGNILNSAGMAASGKTTTSKGGKANTNSGIIRKLALDGTPLVVRIIGNVTAPEGVTAYASVDYGGGVTDNGFMAKIQSGKHITIEGIGTDAAINGWGLSYICQSSDPNLGKSFEVRNISFRNVPEDCVGMEGKMDSTKLTAPVERCWVHHCAFYAPTIANPAEADKAGGDGACDFKLGQYFTNSYCHYQGYHKTGLVGGGDSQLQYHLSYHHNYWENCESRAPLARQADIHMYNNVFYGQSSYCMSLRANTYIFVEYSMFLSCKNVTDGAAGGVAKSFNNTFVSCTGTNNSDLKIVTDRNTKVTSSNLYANFDTDPSMSYIPSGDYLLHTENVYETVLAEAGPQKAVKISSEKEETYTFDAAMDVAAGTDSTAVEEASYADGYLRVIGEVLRRTSGSSVISVQFAKQEKGGFQFTVTGTAKLSAQFSSTGSSNTSALGVRDGSGNLVSGDTGDTIYTTTGASGGKKTVTYTLNAGTYTILCPATGDTTIDGRGARIYKVQITETLPEDDSQLHTHDFTATVCAPGCENGGYTEYACSCGYSYLGDYTAATDHSYANGLCTVCGKIDPDYEAPSGPFTLAGANVILGNDLTMNFALLASNLSGTDYYAEIVKHNPDGTTTTTTYPFSEWTSYAGGAMYLITLDGLVAKQMSDKVEVTIYTTGGEQASYTWEDSIRDYAIRQLNNASNSEKVYTVVADMLNYGAAAQTQFGYNTSDLANATMTDAHKAYATAELDYSQYDNYRMVDDNYFGTILALETNIQMGVFFYDTAEGALTAKVSYRDHNGNAVSYEIAEEYFDTTYAANGLYGILVDTLVAGDVYQLVSVEIYEGDNRISCVEESMESYVVRQSGSLLPIYDALMKFMVSSYNYSH